MEKNEKYLEAKRKYNSNLSTFQISKDLHRKVKDYCKNNNKKVKEFLEDLIYKNI
jgi:ABC-type uncharacterized transport system ATPase subunit